MSQKTFDVLYLQFGVYRESSLFYACGGNFASKAWITSDEAFKQVMGEKFDAITGDDGKKWNINKHAIRRLKDQQEFDELLSQSNPAFKLAIEIEEWNVPVSKWLDKENLFHSLSELIEKFGYDQIRQYAITKLLR